MTDTAKAKPSFPFPPHVQRMVAEADHLAQRLAGLNAFIPTDFFSTLDRHEQLDMIEQQGAMALYLTVLTRRVQRACAQR